MWNKMLQFFRVPFEVFKYSIFFQYMYENHVFSKRIINKGY